MTRLGKGKGGRVLEREYDATILGMAAAYGWLARHHPDSRRAVGDPGEPDWIFVHRATGRLLLVETKVAGGAVSADQYLWFKTLRDGGHDVHILVLPRELAFLEGLLRG